MELKSNLEDIIKKLQQVAKRAEALDFSEPLVAGLNAAMGRMKFRIFNSGQDSKGVSFGKYIGKKTRATNRKFKAKKYGNKENEKGKAKKRKRLDKNKEADTLYTEYEKKRLAFGRQVNFKDLEFTGGLRRGIVVAKISDTKAAVMIPNEQLYKIAKYQSEQISKIVGQELRIFGFSDEEKQINTSTTNELLNQIYAGLFRT